MRVKKRFTEAERREIAEYSVLTTCHEAAKKYHIGARRVTEFRHEFSIKRESRADDYHNAMREVKWGSTYAAAAKKYNVSEGTLNRMIKEAEVAEKGLHPALRLAVVWLEA